MTSPKSKSDSLFAQSDLLNDIERMIEETRTAVAATVNSGITILYWKIGKRIRHDVLKQSRAEYGKKIVVSLARQLAAKYGNGFNEKNLRRMIQFAEVFPDQEIVVSLVRHLSWTHFIALIPLKQPLQREFYSVMCSVEHWSVRTLRRKIDSMLYERTAVSKKPAALARRELADLRDAHRLSPDLVFRDPYVLDFLDLKNAYGERDLEAAILREMEEFLLELGAGFTFVARQKRIMIDDEDFYIDLLFYNRKLRRQVALDLKIGRFKAAYKGQMELYLRWLAKHETEDGEGPPLGIIFCAEGSREQIELLELDKSGIHIAQYITELPPKDLLKRKLHEAITRSREIIENLEEAPNDKDDELSGGRHPQKRKR